MPAARGHRSDKKKSYQCDFEECTKTFTRPYDLARHKRIHNDYSSRQFGCEVPGCNFRANQQAGLKCHVNSIHKGVRLACDYPGCDRTFSDPSSRSKHKQRFHREAGDSDNEGDEDRDEDEVDSTKCQVQVTASAPPPKKRGPYAKPVHDSVARYVEQTDRKGFENVLTQFATFALKEASVTPEAGEPSAVPSSSLSTASASMSSFPSAPSSTPTSTSSLPSTPSEPQGAFPLAFGTDDCNKLQQLQILDSTGHYNVDYDPRVYSVTSHTSFAYPMPYPDMTYAGCNASMAPMCPGSSSGYNPNFGQGMVAPGSYLSTACDGFNQPSFLPAYIDPSLFDTQGSSTSAPAPAVDLTTQMPPAELSSYMMTPYPPLYAANELQLDFWNYNNPLSMATFGQLPTDFQSHSNLPAYRFE